MNNTNYSKPQKVIKKKHQINKTINEERSDKLKTNLTNSQFLKSGFSNKLIYNNEDNFFSNNQKMTIIDKTDKPIILNNHLKINTNLLEKTISKIKDQKCQSVNIDDSDNSSEEKLHLRKDRKPLPLIFNKLRHSYTNSYNDSSSETSEDTKEESSFCKCVYLGERETLRSFWDKCFYECFKSKRCVAGEKPKRKYRKKLKTSKPPIKKRKYINPPISCIDTKGIAVTRNDYLSRYEMLLFMDPLADSMTPWQKRDFEMAFRMVKPTDIFTFTDKDSNEESTDYTNSDTDQEIYD